MRVARYPLRWLGQISLLLVASAWIKCECMEHPLYNAQVNRWKGAYMGGGNSQTRPFPTGFRTAALPEPAILTSECTPQGISLQVWVNDAVAAKSVVSTIPAKATAETNQLRHALDSAAALSFVLPYADAYRLVVTQRDFVVALEDHQGVLTSMAFHADETKAALARCETQLEFMVDEGKGD